MYYMAMENFCGLNCNVKKGQVLIRKDDNYLYLEDKCVCGAYSYNADEKCKKIEFI